jgi:hypothetical protein
VTQARERARREWARFVLLPCALLSVALLGGLRVSAPEAGFVFVAPPLVTLVVAVLVVSLLARGGLVAPGRWLGSHLSLPVNAAHALVLLALFAASAQAVNAVLPERGLFHWLLALFFLWTLWNYQFAPFERERLLRSVAVLFGSAFLVKHLLLGSLYGGPAPGWSRRLLNALLEGATLGSVDAPAFAPATGYVAFLTLALYVGSLWLMGDPAAQAEAPAAREEPNGSG